MFEVDSDEWSILKMHTVKELIDFLQTMPQDASIAIDYEGYYEPTIIIFPHLEKRRKMVGGKLISIDDVSYVNEGGEDIEVDVVVLGKVTAHY